MFPPLRFSNQSNIILTGYLPDDEYIALLKSADVIIVLTSQDHTLTCGSYESIVLGKPMVLTDTEAIKNHFNKGSEQSKSQLQKFHTLQEWIWWKAESMLNEEFKNMNIEVKIDSIKLTDESKKIDWQYRSVLSFFFCKKMFKYLKQDV